MNAEIQRLQTDLGISRGELLQIAREESHDSMIRSLDHLTGEQEQAVITVLLNIAFARREDEVLMVA
jgi:hypothetical protein